MSLDQREIGALLAAVMAYDNRRVGESTVAAWTEAADRGRWSFDEALDAVHGHYSESTEWLMPAHVTTRIREDRRARAAERDRQRVFEQTSRTGDPDDGPGVAVDQHGMPVGDDPGAGRTEVPRHPGLATLHAEAMCVACRACKAPVGERCVNGQSGNPTKIPHHPRLIDARRPCPRASDNPSMRC